MKTENKMCHYYSLWFIIYKHTNLVITTYNLLCKHIICIVPLFLVKTICDSDSFIGLILYLKLFNFNKVKEK